MIQGEKILLRTVREADLDLLFELSSDISKRGEYYPLDIYSQVDFRNHYQEHGLFEDTKGTLLICEEERIVGTISFFPAAYYDGFEIGYILYDTASRGKGYMTEALTLLARHLFFTKKVNRLQLTVVTGNVSSKKVAEKCGFKFEGVVRGAIFHKGKNHDLELFSLLRSEVDIS